MAVKRKFTVEEGLAALLYSDEDETFSEFDGDSDDSVAADFQDEDGTLGHILCDVQCGHNSEDAYYRSSILFDDEESKARSHWYSFVRLSYCLVKNFTTK